MNLPLFIVLIALLGTLSFWLGRKAAAESKSTGDFFLMGRKLGLFGLTLTMLATQMGGGALLGACEEAYARGWNVLFYPLGMVLGMVVLGLGYGAKMRRLNLTTVPEIFEKIYQSIGLRKIASLLSIISLYLILVGQGIAARKFFISLGLNGDALFVLFWCVLVAYTVMGGLGAVVKTDILQACFIFIALFIAVSAAFPISQPAQIAPISSANGSTPWFTWMLMPLLFMLIEQDMGQRCFAAKNPRTVSIAALSGAGILFVVSFVPILFGTTAAALNLTIPSGSSVLISSVQALTNPTVATFVICAVLLAISTTADSLLCSVSSNIACDFPALGTSVFTSRAVTLCVGISTLVLAYMLNNVITILMFSYELAVSVLFVPVTMAVWMNRPQKRSAALSMTLGAASFLAVRIWEVPFPKELVSLILSFTGFIASEWMYKLKTSKAIDSMPT